jgi:hypothetical protein
MLKCKGSRDLLIDRKACMKVVIMNARFEVLAEVLMRIQVLCYTILTVE